MGDGCCTGHPGHGFSSAVEVLSPDSGARDRVTKLRAYFRLPSVQHYLLVWPDE